MQHGGDGGGELLVLKGAVGKGVSTVELNTVELSKAVLSTIELSTIEFSKIKLSTVLTLMLKYVVCDLWCMVCSSIEQVAVLETTGARSECDAATSWYLFNKSITDKKGDPTPEIVKTSHQVEEKKYGCSLHIALTSLHIDYLKILLSTNKQRPLHKS